MKRIYLKKTFLLFVLFICSLSLYAQNGQVSGQVLDENRQPLPGVTISVQGTTIGTSTNADGVYTLTGVPLGTQTVTFNFIGYEELQRSVNVTANTQLDVELVPSAESLSEVVVVGYGTQRKSDLTGSVSSVTPKDFNKGVVATPDQLLQGKVPGLTITRSGGDPTAGATIQLRGPSSLTASTAPFYVIDGVPGANIDLVSPDDIVSMDVMKDASSTAIYGSRAANGVIFVTTKRGKAGKPVLSYSGYAATENVSNRVNVLSADEYTQFLADNGLSVSESEAGAKTDWQDAITRTGVSHNHNVSLTGGSEGTRYNASVNYFKNEGIVKRSEIERIVARLGVDQNAFDDRLRLSLNVSNSVISSNHVDYGIFNGAARFVPVSPIMTDDPFYAQYGGYFQVPGRTGYMNPVAMLNQRDEDRSRNILLATVKAELDILEDLTWTNIGSYQRQNSDKNYYMHTTDFDSRALGLGYAERENLKDIDQILESFLNYNKTINEHSFDAMVGYSYQKTVDNDGVRLMTTGFLSDDLGANNPDAATPPVGYRHFGDYPWKLESLLISFYGRIGYNYNGKYMINATVRRDGSSKFGANNRWATFPSVSAAWRISEEAFLQNQDVLSDLKLRAGYGVSGNQNIDPYKSITIFGQQGGQFMYNGEWLNSYGVNQNPNPDLKWETTSMLNIGLDFAFLNGRLSGTVEYYNKETEDLLYEYSVPTPPYQHDRLLANGATMTNKGVEVALSALAIEQEDFTWNTSVNFAHNQNRVGNLSSNIGNLSVSERYEGSIGLEGWTGQTVAIVLPGQPVGTFYTAKYIGYDEEARKTIYQNAGGELVTADQITARDDYQVMGYALPKFTYGWNNSFSYKQFDLGFFFRGVYGNKIFNATRADLSRLPQAGITNISKDAVEDGIFETPTIASSRFLEDGSFLRLENATLGYTFDVSNWRFFNSARIYVTGQNLFTITDYTGVDPEVNLNGLAPGIDDRNYYPKTRSFLLGINVNF